jgi:hypothetical protein
MVTKRIAGTMELAVRGEVVLLEASKVSANIAGEGSVEMDSTLNGSETSDSATCAIPFDASSARWVAICSFDHPWASSCSSVHIAFGYPDVYIPFVV